VWVLWILWKTPKIGADECADATGQAAVSVRLALDREEAEIGATFKTAIGAAPHEPSTVIAEVRYDWPEAKEGRRASAGG